MITIEKVCVFNWEAAIRGLRNPMNSWDKSDSYYDSDGNYIIGENDLALAKKLTQAGPDHRKFLRQIFVSMDITAPLYWWKEFDTYKVGTVANSCSTMHKIHEKEFTVDDFSHEHLLGIEDFSFTLDFETDLEPFKSSAMGCLEIVVGVLNGFRRQYLESKDKTYWWQMIQLLPSSYNQLRTVTMTYENLLNMYRARKDHKLDEWREFCGTIAELPYFKEVIGCES